MGAVEDQGRWRLGLQLSHAEPPFQRQPAHFLLAGWARHRSPPCSGGARHAQHPTHPNTQHIPTCTTPPTYSRQLPTPAACIGTAEQNAAATQHLQLLRTAVTPTWPTDRPQPAAASPTHTTTPAGYTRPLHRSRLAALSTPRCSMSCRTSGGGASPSLSARSHLRTGRQLSQRTEGGPACRGRRLITGGGPGPVQQEQQGQRRRRLQPPGAAHRQQLTALAA